jgi:hypothetical protein
VLKESWPKVREGVVLVRMDYPSQFLYGCTCVLRIYHLKCRFGWEGFLTQVRSSAKVPKKHEFVKS